MKSIEEYRHFLQSDPETLVGVPSDDEIISSNPDLKRWSISLTDGERIGFLQIWQMGKARSAMNDLNVPELQNLRDELDATLAEPHLAREIDELRLLKGFAAVAIGKVK
jgi:hypothetical protein